MNNTSSFQPNWASAPGETIADILDEKKLSLTHFAAKMDKTVDGVNSLINGTTSITPEISHKLESVLGVSFDFWLAREEQYRQSLVRLKQQEESWLKMLPIKDMIHYGWLKATVDNKVSACLNYFGVASINSWYERFELELPKVAFRTSSILTAKPGAIATWIRQGEIVSNSIQCEDWNQSLFRETLKAVKVLTRQKDPQEFIPKLTKLCASCGVAIAIVPTPKGCPASGLTKFVTPKRALLMLSFRYLTDDHFWFTFFHEAGHLLLHNNKSIFVEEITKERIVNKMEEEANEFAANELIPKELHSQLLSLPVSNKRAIIKFASLAGVSPGIVIGQLQHMGRIEYNRLNSYKRRYSWDEINSVV